MSEWTKGIVRLSCSAECFGEVAILCDLRFEKPWRVVHIDSGYRIGHFRLEKDARHLAELIGDLPLWKRVEVFQNGQTPVVPTELVEQIKRALSDMSGLGVQNGNPA